MSAQSQSIFLYLKTVFVQATKYICSYCKMYMSILLNQIVLSHEWPRVSPGLVFAHSRPTPSLKPEKVENNTVPWFSFFHIYFAYILDIFYIYCTYISKFWRVVLICLKSSTFIEAGLLRANEVSWFQTNRIFFVKFSPRTTTQTKLICNLHLIFQIKKALFSELLIKNSICGISYQGRTASVITAPSACGW